MDTDILRIILKNYDDAENVIQSENDKNSRENLLCLQSDTILNTLCKSLCNLLQYKVSKEAYQRYSIQMLIIDILRKWCRVTGNLEHLQIFMSIENTLKYVNILLDKYLTDNVLIEGCSENALISLTTAVIYLSVENTSFISYVNRLLIKLSQLETNNKIEILLHDAIYSNLYVESSTKEKIYISQKFKLIEEPLLDTFVYMFPDLKKNCINNWNNDNKILNQLLEFTCRSPYVFQLIFNFLKELLIQSQYASVVLNFIDFILKQISTYCEHQNRDILDLYPRKLRPYIILLNIKPEHHTARTQKYTLQIMKQIFEENRNVLLILMSHFPEWLECFTFYVTNDVKKKGYEFMM